MELPFHSLHPNSLAAKEIFPFKGAFPEQIDLTAVDNGSSKEAAKSTFPVRLGVDLKLDYAFNLAHPTPWPGADGSI